MIILGQDLFSIEVFLSISEILRPLTTSDEDRLRNAFSRMPEYLPEGNSEWLTLPKQKSPKGGYYFGEKHFPPSEGATNQKFMVYLKQLCPLATLNFEKPFYQNYASP